MLSKDQCYLLLGLTCVNVLENLPSILTFNRCGLLEEFIICFNWHLLRLDLVSLRVLVITRDLRRTLRLVTQLSRQSVGVLDNIISIHVIVSCFSKAMAICNEDFNSLGRVNES
jgi:hypothetical protein